VSERKPNPSPSNNQPVLIAGPTGVGKTEFAVALAQRVGGELVCADAFQIYRGFRLLTARPTIEEEALARHHLFGFVSPGETWDVVRQLECMEAVCGEIQQRGKTPILVGGTGLYFQAFLYGFDPTPPADLKLRAELTALPLGELVARLERLDPQAAGQIDLGNPRRVIRAIEIVTLSGRPLAAARSRWKTNPRSCEAVYLTRDREQLHRRQARNIRRMIEAGVLEEVARVRADGVGETAAKALGYREFCAVLDGRMSLGEAEEKLVVLTRQYARRQETWFRQAAVFVRQELG
jgi:tRNA dimethylallyltransferase